MANVRVRCRDFSKLRVYAVYWNQRPPSLFGEHCEILQTAHMAKFEENIEEMVGTTREAAAGRDGDEKVATAGDETAATGGVMFTDEGELEFDEDEMAALEGQRLVAELFPDSGSEPDFEGFHASELAGDLRAETTVDRKRSPSRMMMMTGHLSDAAAVAAYRTNPNLPDFINSHGPLIHASGSSAYEIFLLAHPR